ncbi:sigma-70 family RNA polymerase sigma factor [Oceanobacillus massiliensis]|uniref:sigma-70 family RNA polymerase sigma factor n=1 Tax=Oceanobacillus massiliensis TaxID=1465765 RepID=UPI0002FA374B|nr:sigma-70 family RNA polymerase sigma factor [Oceanobacillus massiliensis]
MNESKRSFTFEEIFSQNEKRIHYYINRLDIRDPNEDFYEEGLFALWKAYETYEPDKGPMTTYFNYLIKHRLIDRIRKENNSKKKLEHFKLVNRAFFNDGNYKCGLGTNTTLKQSEDITAANDQLWSNLKQHLSENQWKWVKYFILEDLSVKTIAEMEDTSIEAVKSWGKEVRKKLRGTSFRDKIGWIIEDG